MKKGFTSLYIVMILGTLMLLLLSAAEAASAYAARAEADNIFASAGRSVLSEFQSELFGRYGIFAVRAFDDELSVLGKYYMDESCGGSGAAKLSCQSCRVNSENYPALSKDLFKEQVKALGKYSAAEDVVSSLSGAAEKLSRSSEEQDDMRRGSLDSLEELADQTEEDEDGRETEDSAAKRAEAKRLLRDYRDSTDPDLDGRPAREEDAHGIAGNLYDDLPTKLLGVRSSKTALISGGIFGNRPEDMLADIYSMSVCSNALAKKDDSFLSLEAEYLLFGQKSDDANMSCVRRSLYAMRFSLDLADVLSDPAKMSEYASVAAGFTFLPKAPVIFVLASIDAGSRARADLTVLFNGGKVPITKSLPNFGSYEDHLRVLLMFVSGDAKLARLMDIMQLNVSQIDGKAFAFRDYAYGFDMDAEFEKPVRWHGFLGIDSTRTCHVEKAFCYK